MNQFRPIVLILVCLVNFPLFASAHNTVNKNKTLKSFQSHQHLISGKVVDKSTGEAIPYCSIALASSSIGTATNELGEFVLAVDSLPAKLIFSHLNYTQFSLEIFQTSDVVISLEPLTTVLEEVVVKASKKDVFAIALAKKAFQKAEKESDIGHYGRAFYRQKSKNGENYSEFSEIFYDIRYSTNGIEDWNIAEGRYALTDNAIYNRNYTLFSRILRPSQPNTDDLILPSHPSFEIFYRLNIVDIVQSADSKIAVVHFKPLKKVKAPAFEGDVYIDMNTFDILKINWSLARDDLDFVALATKKGSWKDYSISYEIAYKKDSLSVPLLDYIKVDQSFDYYKDNNFQSRSATTSNLTFYEHYTPTSRKRLGKRLRSGQSDWKKLDEIGYNEQFWSDNPIVKRTPIEEEVISSFEKEDAFSSIFLNSAENIALMTSNISDDSFIQELSTQMNLYNNYNPTEKVFLHTDKNLFSTGEYIWYSAYTVIGPNHQFTTGSRVLHVDLIGPDSKIIQSQTHELLGGRGSGNIKLPENLLAGTYQLRAYTQWMRNFDSNFFFTKNISILNDTENTDVSEKKEDQVDLQFFPEGGQLVAGIAGKVAFKAIGNDGLGKKVKGQILDSGGKPVAVLNTFDRGAGFFQLLPILGEQYTAMLDDGAIYQLPMMLDSGYAFRVDNLNEKSIRINVQASEVFRNKAFYVVAHMRQRKLYQGRFEFGEKPSMRIEIPKTQMPSGVFTITLFDENKKPWCERPVFVNNQEELVITTNIDQQKFTKRDKIGLQVNITDTDGRPVAGEFSMAVTDVGQVIKDQSADNILTQLLLQSDIKGHVSNPGLLFKDQKRATLHALDLVMLSNGWRTFNWTEVLEPQNQKKEFKFAKGLVLSGKARRLNGKPMGETNLNIIAKSGELLGMLSTKTNLGGKFVIPDFNFKDNTEIVFNAFNSNDKPVNVKVTLDKNKITVPISPFKSLNSNTSKDTEDYLAYSSTRTQMDALYNLEDITELDEVVVTEKKVEQGGSPSIYGQTADATIYTADNVSAYTVLDLVRRFAGVTVSGNNVSIRNGGTPLWVLDGIPVYNDNPSSSNAALYSQNPNANSVATLESSTRSGPAPTFIATMDTFTVERVELLKGPSAAIYGSRGGNGVILVYTKRGVGTTKEPVLSPDFTVMGHTSEREFYSPKYDVELDKHSTPDYRATLYWNPSFSTDIDGNATIEFFNSDMAKEIQVSIEGLSPYGIPGSYLQTFGNND